MNHIPLSVSANYIFRTHTHESTVYHLTHSRLTDLGRTPGGQAPGLASIRLGCFLQSRNTAFDSF